MSKGVITRRELARFWLSGGVPEFGDSAFGVIKGHYSQSSINSSRDFRKLFFHNET